MSREHIEDLKEALSLSLLESPYDPSGYTPEHNQIRKLAEVVQAFDVGSISTNHFLTILRNNPIPGFSWDHWLSQMVDEGLYDEKVLTGGDPEDDPEE